MAQNNSPLQSQFGAKATASEVAATVDLRGKQALVTGGASGLGYETSLALAKAGAAVSIAVRNLEQGNVAADKLRSEVAGSTIAVHHLDLADLKATRSFAAAYLKAVPTVDILINNAAVMACPLTRTAQGWELQFATNHLGHFALTTDLLPALLRAADASGDARVVSVSSVGHKISGVVFDDIHFERREYNKWKAYGQAKSANALFALGLHQRFGARGLVANAVHPGGIMTGLQKYISLEEQRQLGWLRSDDTPIDIFKTPEQGAATSVWAAVAPELRGNGGLYLEDCRQAIETDKSNRSAGYAAHVASGDFAEQLWQLSDAAIAG